MKNLYMAVVLLIVSNLAGAMMPPPPPPPVHMPTINPAAVHTMHHSGAVTIPTQAPEIHHLQPVNSTNILMVAALI